MLCPAYMAAHKDPLCYPVVERLMRIINCFRADRCFVSHPDRELDPIRVSWAYDARFDHDCDHDEMARSDFQEEVGPNRSAPVQLDYH